MQIALPAPRVSDSANLSSISLLLADAQVEPALLVLATFLRIAVF